MGLFHCGLHSSLAGRRRRPQPAACQKGHAWQRRQFKAASSSTLALLFTLLLFFTGGRGLPAAPDSSPSPRKIQRPRGEAEERPTALPDPAAAARGGGDGGGAAPGRGGAQRDGGGGGGAGGAGAGAGRPSHGARPHAAAREELVGGERARSPRGGGGGAAAVPGADGPGPAACPQRAARGGPPPRCPLQLLSPGERRELRRDCACVCHPRGRRLRQPCPGPRRGCLSFLASPRGFLKLLRCGFTFERRAGKPRSDSCSSPWASSLVFSFAAMQSRTLFHPPSALMSSLHPLLPQCLYQFLVFVPPSNGSLSTPGTAVAALVDTQHPLTLLLNGSVGDRELCKYVAEPQASPS